MPEGASYRMGQTQHRPARRSTWPLAALAMAPLVLGCTGDEPGPPAQPSVWQAQSGARLTARYLVGEDGTRVFEGWFDSARGELCQIRRGEGGRYHCFPEGNPAVYLDNRCRQPAGEHLACAHRYTAVARGDRRCNNETMSLWQEGAPLELPAPYRLSDDFCLEPQLGGGGGPYVSLGERVADTALVSGTMELARPDLRLGPRVVRFSDGAIAPLELFDVGRNKPCARMETSAGIRCLPENVVYLGGEPGPYFIDRACTQPMAHALAPACLQPVLALQLDRSSGCNRVTAAFSVVSNQRRDPREAFSGALCRSGQVLPGHFYVPGDPVDLTVFPELVLQETGSGRIRVRSFAARDGVSIPTLGEHLFDTALGLECKVAVANDGVRRCLPLSGPAVDQDSAAGSDDGFADAECTRALARYRSGQACGGPQPPAAMVARVSSRRCLAEGETGPGSRDDRQPGRWQILRLGARHEGDVYFRVAGACTAQPRAPGEDFFELGEAVDPASFVAFRTE